MAGLQTRVVPALPTLGSGCNEALAQPLPRTMLLLRLMTLKEAWEIAGALVVSVGGSGAIVLGLSSWLGKVWASRILEEDRAKFANELERLKTDLDRTTRLLQGEIEKTLFVTKTHFETEFQILRDIWQKVSAVRARMSVLRPVMSIVDLRISSEQALDEDFPPFLIAVKDLVDAVDHNSPFYPPEIFTRLDQLIRIAQRERDDIGLSDRKESLSFAGRGRWKANFDEFCSVSDAISGQIRERLEKLSIRPTP